MTKIYGLDLSYHNGTVDFDSVKKNNGFVILRAGYGVSGTKDSKFEEYYKAAKAAGLNVGAYYYSYALTEANAKAEAKNFVSYLKNKSFEMPVFIDMEDADGYKNKNGMPSNATLVKICETFCEYMEEQGYFAGIYASESWLNSQLKNLSDDYMKWVAKWGTNNGKLNEDISGSYKLHQFTSKYSLNGKTFDRNVMYYDYPNAITKAGLNGTSSSSTSTKSSASSIEDEDLDPDGKWGELTTRKAQKVFKTTEDGIVSNQYASYRTKNPGLLSTTFDWQDSPKSTGSKLIKAIQKKIGLKTSQQDGFIGPTTITAMQKWLGTKQDGYVSNPSSMVKAFQKWLNNQK